MWLRGQRQPHARRLPMKALDFILPAKNSAMSAGNETPAFRPSSAESSEPFDALMSRALAPRDNASGSPLRPGHGYPTGLAKPSPDHGQGSYAAKKSSSGSRSSGASKIEASASRRLKPADHTKSSSPDASLSPATHDRSVHGAAKEKHGGISSDEDSDSLDAEDNNPSLAPGADSANGDAAAALQTLASSEAVQITLQAASAAIVVSKIAGTGAGNNPGATGAAPQVSISKTADDASEGAKDVSGKMSKPGANKPAGDVKEIPVSSSESAKNSGSADGAVPIQALLDKAKISKEPASIAEDSASGNPQSPLSEAAGISAAQQVATMKNTDNAPKIAGDLEQSLPGVTVVAAAQSPAREKPAPKAVSRMESPETTAVGNSSAVDRAPAVLESSSSSLISASSQTDLRVRALDRTHDIMALHGMRLKESNADSLHVVIKPGAGLQLSLQLKQNGDGIEAHAVLQRGDFNQLNQHWTELQQRLEQRGIRLAPLGHENSAASNSNENFQHQPHPPAEQDSLSAGAFAELALAGSSAPRFSRAAGQRGWESWA